MKHYKHILRRCFQIAAALKVFALRADVEKCNPPVFQFLEKVFSCKVSLVKLNLIIPICVSLCYNFWWESLLLQSPSRKVLSCSQNTHLCICVFLCFNLCLLSKVHLVNWSFRKPWPYRPVFQLLVRVSSSKVSLAKWSLIKRWSYRSVFQCFFVFLCVFSS